MSNFLGGGGSGGGSGSGTVSSGATNAIPKYVAATTVDDSLLSDDATTLTYTGSGGVSAPSFTSTAGGAEGGWLKLTEGTTPASGPATGVSFCYADSTTHRIKCSYNNASYVELGSGSLISWQKATSPVTGNAADQTVYSTTISSIPAGACIRVSVDWLNSTATAANKVFKWSFGGSVVFTYTANSNNSTTNPNFAGVRICNDPGVQNAQTILADPLFIGASGNNAGGYATSAVNTSGSQTLAFIFNAAATEAFTGKGFLVERIQ